MADVLTYRTSVKEDDLFGVTLDVAVVDQASDHLVHRRMGRTTSHEANVDAESSAAQPPPPRRMISSVPLVSDKVRVSERNSALSLRRRTDVGRCCSIARPVRRAPRVKEARVPCSPQLSRRVLHWGPESAQTGHTLRAIGPNNEDAAGRHSRLEVNDPIANGDYQLDRVPSPRTRA